MSPLAVAHLQSTQVCGRWLCVCTRCWICVGGQRLCSTLRCLRSFLIGRVLELERQGWCRCNGHHVSVSGADDLALSGGKIVSVSGSMGVVSTKDSLELSASEGQVSVSGLESTVEVGSSLSLKSENTASVLGASVDITGKSGDVSLASAGGMASMSSKDSVMSVGQDISASSRGSVSVSGFQTF